jgi:anthranilate phosphoribosyltransferase
MGAAAWFAQTLATLINRQDLGPVRMCELMEQILAGAASDAELAALLVALRMKGETSAEVAAAAAVLREHMIPLRTGRNDLLDTCGTGGDGLGTFNVSTATALVAAGAGVAVVKHGSRAMSGKSGSADVLAELGVRLDMDPATACRCLERAGMAFCLAPNFHPALKRVSQLRQRLGVRTLFNCLGPLANPAGAAYHLCGVGWPEWLDRLAGAVFRLEPRHALLVCGQDGLDEVTLTGATYVRQVRGGHIRSLEWTPSDFGLEPCSLADLRVGSAADSARVIRSVLDGQPGPAWRMVVANAAAALLAADRVASLPEGVELARQTIASGAALRVLEQLIACSRGEETAPHGT